ncbi:MAG: O-antigen ligase family protein, partial [Candidatus Staskawiczbacteria bacterium]
MFNKIFLSNLGGRPSSTMGNPDLLATYILLLFFIALCYAIKEKVLKTKIFYIFSLLLFLYTIIITGSRAAYLGIAIGAAYFFLFYPKKMKVLKTTFIGMLVVLAGFIFYINAAGQYPKFLEKNSIFNSVAQRVSAHLILTDPRFYAWAKIDYKILMEKPVLGWGPENFSVGFDKYYDPAIPYLNQSWGDWWDRAHNIILQTGSDAGILGILAYLFLFIFLFLQLQKLKRHPQESADKNENPRLIAHGIQATFIGYLVANFFGFDSFSTYLIFFLLVGYALYLISSNTTKTENPHEPAVIRINLRIKSAFMFILFCVLIFFLWQYNILPLQINAKINNASNLADQKQCSQAFSAMDKILKEHSFLDSYARLEYVEFTKTCDNFYPENNLTYIQNGIKLINEAVKIQPLYTRYWIYLGSSTGFMASQEKNNPVAENDLMRQANYYFGKASQLSPKRQEVPIAQAKMEIALEDYNGSQNYLEKCIALNPGLADCYWYLGITEIYKKDIADAQKNIQLAHDKIYDIWSKTSLNELSDAYGSISDYQDLVPVYNGLIAINPNVAQYHSSLAFFY